jgi:tetratricopeptide (TPR) repeat protein
MAVVPIDTLTDTGTGMGGVTRGEADGNGDPDAELVLSTLGASSRGLGSIGRKKKAGRIPQGREGLLLNALAADPRNVDALTRLGLLYEQRQQWAKCIELLHRATMVDPPRTEYLWVHVAHAHLCQQQWQETLDTVHHAVKHPENRINAMLHYTVGRLYDRVDQQDVAEHALRECLKLSPWYPESREVFFRLGCMYREMKKYQRAFYCLNKAVADGNGSGYFDLSVMWLELGVVARLLHKQEEAEAAFANAGLDPTLGTTWHYAGNDYLGKLEYLKAFRCYRKVRLFYFLFSVCIDGRSMDGPCPRLSRRVLPAVFCPWRANVDYRRWRSIRRTTTCGRA